MSRTVELNPAPGWSGPSRAWFRRPRRRFSWRRSLWSLLYPQRHRRVLPTPAGLLLILLTGSLAVAAYNTASNILFITLSLLLSGLILSGVLSWANGRRVSWRLHTTPPYRVGQTATAAVRVRNLKRLLPTYGLWFDLRSTSLPGGTQVRLAGRLEPNGGEDQLEWTFRPVRRGLERIDLTAVGSHFPFGFMRRVIGADVRQEAVVWPTPIEYQRLALTAPERPQSGEEVARMGQNGDLLALRRYAPGDSHRLIHWKASARLRTLMVRQFASETQQGLSLWLETDAALWPRQEQFERLCSLVVTLAEDLFKAGRLGTVAINEQAPSPIRRLRDLEAFFDQVALLEPTVRRVAQPAASPARPPGAGRARRNLLSFSPQGTQGVVAQLDGQPAATA